MAKKDEIKEPPGKVRAGQLRDVTVERSTQTAADAKFDKIIEIRSVTKEFDGVTVVDDLSLSIKRGDFVTLLGPSGCGKTTLLRMIAGFIEPTGGKILLNKQDLTNLPPHKRPVNTVFQNYALFPHLNVFNNIAFGLKLKKIESAAGEKPRKFTKAEINEKVENALKLVGLSDYGKRDVNSLSGGQKQRVAIARALVCEPQVLLLDEPLGALDLKMRKEMQGELMSMHKRLGITFVYVTHDQEEALRMSDKIVVINDGRIQQEGTPQRIYDEPANAFVADFIGESNILSGTMVADYKVEFCGKIFACADKGFNKNERVDLVIRPEDLEVSAVKNDAGGVLVGTVLSKTFKGTFFEMNIKAENYEFTAQSTTGHNVGDSVSLSVAPHGIHIMRKTKTANEFITEVTGENTVSVAGGDFEFLNTQNLEVGQKVKVTVPFDKVVLTDHEGDGTVGGNIGRSLYKGSYYQVQVYTDDDDEIYLDTTDEWDIDDRVGITIPANGITVEKYDEPEESTESDKDTTAETDGEV